MTEQKTVAAIHDLSGLGKCSLTAAIPVLSAAGVSVGVLPTAVLSTQTGGLNEYTYRDLTEDMRSVMSHWKRIGVSFDAIYSGFLGSSEQINIVSDFVKEFKNDGTVFLCDPAMADNGKMYDTFDNDFAAKMTKLCSYADIIVPNITEAAFMIGKPFSEPPYDENYIVDILHNLYSLTNVNEIVVTGVNTDGKSIGAVSFNASENKISWSLRPMIQGVFHSTGDIFASSLLGGILCGFSVDKSCEIAIDFTVNSIKRTVNDGGDSRFGLHFEKCLPSYMKDLELI